MVRKEDSRRAPREAQTEAEAARARVEAVGGDAVRELEQIAADLADQAQPSARRWSRRSTRSCSSSTRTSGAQKQGVGAAAIVDGVCQACHEKLSAVELDRLKHTEGVKRCEYCRRIVVFA